MKEINFLPEDFERLVHFSFIVDFSTMLEGIFLLTGVESSGEYLGEDNSGPSELKASPSPTFLLLEPEEDLAAF